jgi:hypothetical protein
MILKMSAQPGRHPMPALLADQVVDDEVPQPVKRLCVDRSDLGLATRDVERRIGQQTLGANRDGPHRNQRHQQPLSGFEPLAVRLQSGRSDRLSYAALNWGNSLRPT